MALNLKPTKAVSPGSIFTQLAAYAGIISGIVTSVQHALPGVEAQVLTAGGIFVAAIVHALRELKAAA